MFFLVFFVDSHSGGVYNNGYKYNLDDYLNKNIERRRTVKKTIWGQTKEGENISIYTLENENGMEVSFLDFGANVRYILVPDAKGERADVVLGFDKLEDFFQNPAFYGC